MNAGQNTGQPTSDRVGDVEVAAHTPPGRATPVQPRSKSVTVGLWIFAGMYWLAAAAAIYLLLLPYAARRLGLSPAVYATAYQINDASSCAQTRLGVALLSTRKPLLADDVDEAEIACEDEVIIRQQLRALGKTPKRYHDGGHVERREERPGSDALADPDADADADSGPDADTDPSPAPSRT